MYKHAIPEVRPRRNLEHCRRSSRVYLLKNVAFTEKRIAYNLSSFLKTNYSPPAAHSASGPSMEDVDRVRQKETGR